eukprot:NODE_78_length_23131_cov_0.599427.p5 type:complete len:527 gc:universal NODE_78_length_23131_cov_0.599427:11596-10016(-)
MILEIVLTCGIIAVIYYRFIKKDQDDEFMKELMVKQLKFQESLEVEEVVKVAKCDITILYSTQTGNALYYSNKIHDLIVSYNMTCQIINVGKVDLQVNLPCKLVVFVVSTFGDGDPSDDGILFFKSLKLNGKNIFSDVDKVILGLGSSTYTQFNQAAKLLRKLVGSPNLYKELDETKSLEMEFYNFSSQFEIFLVHFGKQIGYPMLKSVKKINIIYDSTFSNISFGFPVHSVIVDRNYPKLMKVKSINKIFKTDRICWHMEFEVNKQDPAINWEYGDHVAIYPQNATSKVEEVARYFNLFEKDENRQMTVISGPTILDCDLLVEGNAFSSEIKLDKVIQWEKEEYRTLRTFLTFYVDLNVCVPLLLVEKLKALGYCSVIDEVFYKDQIFHNKIALIDFLKLFKIPGNTAVLECILLYMARISARWYSICSSERLGDGISICAVTLDYDITQPKDIEGTRVTEYKTKHNTGLCTGYFTRCWEFLEKSGKSYGNATTPLLVPVFTRKSNFKVPKHPLPLLFVGPGVYC